MCTGALRATASGGNRRTQFGGLGPTHHGACGIEQGQNVWPGDAVEYIRPISSVGDQPGFAQHGKLLRNICLAITEMRLQVADALFTTAQGFQNGETHRMHQSSEQTRLARQAVIVHALNYIQILAYVKL